MNEDKTSTGDDQTNDAPATDATEATPATDTPATDATEATPATDTPTTPAE